MGNVKKLVAAAVIIVIICGGAYGVKYLSNVKKYKNIIKSISINKVDLSKVKNGSYFGNFDAIFVAAGVNVKVKNHEIVDVKLVKHKNERGKRAEVIPDKVVKAQSLQIDTISGATNSSKVILKAIENALEKGEDNA